MERRLRYRTERTRTLGCRSISSSNNNSSSHIRRTSIEWRCRPRVPAEGWSTATGVPSRRPPSSIVTVAAGRSWLAARVAVNTIAVVLATILVYHRARRLWECQASRSTMRREVGRAPAKLVPQECLLGRCAIDCPYCHNSSSSPWTTSTADTRDCCISSSSSKDTLPRNFTICPIKLHHPRLKAY